MAGCLTFLAKKQGAAKRQGVEKYILTRPHHITENVNVNVNVNDVNDGKMAGCLTFLAKNQGASLFPV